jgi:hypothetical protein
MTKKELNDSIVRCIILSDPPYPTVKIAKLVDAIWGQPFDGETEKIPTPADMLPKSVSGTSEIPQTNPAPFVSETDVRVAEFKGKMSAISQAHEMWLRESFTDKEPCSDRIDPKTPPQPQ